MLSHHLGLRHETPVERLVDNHLLQNTSTAFMTSHRHIGMFTTMRTSSSLFTILLCAFFSSLALAANDQRRVDVFAWPLSASTAQSLASISYTSTNATLNRYTAPTISADDDVVRIGFHHPSGSWSGVATAASNFAPGLDKKILLHLSSTGELYHVGFRVSDVPSSGTGRGSTREADGVSVEIVQTQPGAAPQLSKPVVVNAQGEVDNKEPEKSFIQKYWWVIAGFFVLQLVMGGGGKE